MPIKFVVAFCVKLSKKKSKKVASPFGGRHFWVIHGKHFDIIACRWVGGQRKNQHRLNGFQRVPKSNHKNKQETVCTENGTSWPSEPTTKLNSPCWTADKFRGGVKGGSLATHRKREEKLLELLTQAISSFSTEDSDHEPKGQQKGSDQKSKSTTGGKGKRTKNSTDQENSPPRGKKKEKKKKTLIQALGQLVDRYSKNPTGNLLQRLTQLVAAAQTGKLQIEEEPGSHNKHTTNSTDYSTNKKGKGKGTNQKEARTTEFAQPHAPKQSPISYYPKTGDFQDGQWTTVQRRRRKKNTQHNSVPSAAPLQLCQDAWPPGAIISEGTLRYKLEKGLNPQPGKVAFIQSVDAIKHLQELATVHGITTEFALLTTEKGQLEQQKSFATSRNNRRQIDKLWITALNQKLPRFPQEPVSKTINAPSEVTLTTFRITIPQQFLTQRDWEQTAKNPGQAATALCDKQHIHSTYGWKQSQVGWLSSNYAGRSTTSPKT